jgi:hypothetical protein
MLSHAYATSTEGDPKAATIDPKNDLVSHFSRRRLSAEEIRDAMLFVSGKLELGAPGRHAFPPETDWRYTQHSPFVAVYPSDRRGVYLMQQRIKKHPLLDVFDGADPNATTADRPVSITALQALFLLNDRLVHTQADALADRLIAAKSDDRGRIDLAFQLHYGRPASPDELATASAYLDSRRADLVATDVPPDRRGQAALASFARVLLGSNEFLYVD